MAERIDLTTPYQADPRTASQFQVSRLDLNWGAAMVVVEVRDDETEITRQFTYEGAIATAMMAALNKANLATKSLRKRVLEQLVIEKLQSASTKKRIRGGSV